MDKKNLLLISYDFPPSTGGIARLCHEISVGMQAYYQSIKVITVTTNEVSTPYNDSQIDLIRLTPKRLYSEIEAIKKIRKIKNKKTYDVLCGVWHPEAILAYLGGMKNVYILGHGTEFLYGTSTFRKLFWLPFYAKNILVKADKVIANSNYTSRLIQSLGKRINVEPLPLAVNHNFFKPSEKLLNSRVIKFSTVSRVQQFKGHDFILETFEKLPIEIRAKVEWHIAGTGPYLKELKEKIENSPIKNQVFLHGFVSDDKLSDFYNSTDVFILATREQKLSTQIEGFGLVFLEAQSCGVPAIGTNTGGIPDAIDHNNGGWLIEQDNVGELQELLMNIVKNPELITEQSNKARERVLLDYTWDLYCEKLYSILSR